MPSEKEANQGFDPTFGPHPKTQVAHFSFHKEEGHLLLKCNLGDIPLAKECQAKFIDLIYSKQEVFSLHDEDLVTVTD